VKCWTGNISGNIEAAFLRLAPQVCITGGNKVTPLVFAIATLSAPVSLCHKKQMSPFAAFKVRQRVLLGTNIVLILS